MIGKLLKYDLRQSAGKFIISVAILAGLLLSTALLTLFNIAIVNNLLLVLCVFAGIGLLFMYVVFSIMDFYKSMSGKGSYFTYMLPVGINKILLSKFITVIIWGAVTVVSEALFWLGLNKILLGKMGLSFASLIDTVLANRELVGYTLMMVLVQYLGIIMIVAFCISLTSVPRFKNNGMGIPVGVIAYVVINNAVSMLVAGIIFASAYVSGKLQMVLNDSMTPEYTLTFMKSLGVVMLISYAVIIPLFWHLTSLMYKKHRTV